MQRLDAPRRLVTTCVPLLYRERPADCALPVLQRDSYDEIVKAGFQVYGISSDKPAAQLVRRRACVGGQR